MRRVLKGAISKDLEGSEVGVSMVIPVKDVSEISYESLPQFRPEDELIIAEGGWIGDARIEGVKRAKNNYIAFADSDAYYPPDYLVKVEKGFEIFERGFYTLRKGGCSFINQRIEAGLCVERGFFLERVEGWKALYPRHDVGELFDDLGWYTDAWYYHHFTKSESVLVSSVLWIPVYAVIKFIPVKVVRSVLGS